MGTKIIFLDTTMRDGEQTPGVNMNIEEKSAIAHRLERMGVDIIEAGFAAASPGDFSAISEISKNTKEAYVCSLARTVKEDIDTAWEAVKFASKPYIHTFIATSDIHMKYKLKMSEEQVLENAAEAVKYAKRFCEEVEFSAEDATRSRREFLYKVLEAVIKEGATCINIPDTVGYTTPDEFYKLISDIKENVEGVDKVRLSVHCHNDLGLATANTLSAICAGATQAECSINGIGERAGNTSFEEVVMALKTRSENYNGAETGVDIRQIARTSKLVSSVTGIAINPLKPIIGANAFAHESGIHQDGVLKNPLTYEIMKPESIGLAKPSLALGKLSGRAAFRSHIRQMGYELGDEALDRAFKKFKDLADKKKNITDEDIEAIINERMSHIPEVYSMESFQISSGNHMTATATVTMIREGESFTDAATGDGPVDAMFKTIERMSGISATLESYSLRAVTDGTDALSEASVMINIGGKKYRGKAISTDVIESSARAYLNAINRSML